MRSPPRLTPTSQTPVLPGFVVCGDAKNAGFEAFGVSPELYPIPSMTQVCDPSVLTPANRHLGEGVQKGPPFERVQIPASVEHQPWSLRPFPPHRQARSFERVQLTAASHSDGTLGDCPRPTRPPFERVQTPPPSGHTPDIASTAPPFERVQMTREGASFPVTPRLTRPPHRRPPRLTPAHETPLRSTATQKQETPMPTTQ